MESEVTIDVLAQEFELPVSTIRMYQSRRLIPPPTKRGRVGFYADTHRERLSAIGALQDRGFSLAAIKETLDSWEAGASVGELIGARSIAGTSVEEPLVELTGAELRERFGKEGLTATQIRRAAELGIVEVDGATVRASRTFLDAGTQLRSKGVSVDEILDEYEAMKNAISGVADRFVALFDQHLWKPFADAGKPVAGMGPLADDVTELIGLAKVLVAATLDNELTTRTEQRMAQLR